MAHERGEKTLEQIPRFAGRNSIAGGGWGWYTDAEMRKERKDGKSDDHAGGGDTCGRSGSKATRSL
jgi:hypothetical protein